MDNIPEIHKNVKAYYSECFKALKNYDFKPDLSRLLNQVFICCNYNLYNISYLKYNYRGIMYFAYGEYIIKVNTSTLNIWVFIKAVNCDKYIYDFTIEFIIQPNLENYKLMPLIYCNNIYGLQSPNPLMHIKYYSFKKIAIKSFDEYIDLYKKNSNVCIPIDISMIIAKLNIALLAVNSFNNKKRLPPEIWNLIYNDFIN